MPIVDKNIASIVCQAIIGKLCTEKKSAIRAKQNFSVFDFKIEKVSLIMIVQIHATVAN
ncbi:MAG: hypothetical protein PQ975_04330 [Methanobacterium sp.]|jgi:hypothetical protein